MKSDMNTTAKHMHQLADKVSDSFTTAASVTFVAKIMILSRFDHNYTVITHQHTVQNIVTYRKLRLLKHLRLRQK